MPVTSRNLLTPFLTGGVGPPRVTDPRLIVLNPDSILEAGTILERDPVRRSPLLPKVPTAPPVVPQLAFPMEMLPSGQFNELEQDSLDEIAMAVEIILRYPVGSRMEVPGFGIPDLSFRNSMEEVSAILLEHVSRWEPRADLLVQEERGRWDAMIQEYALTVRSRQGI